MEFGGVGRREFSVVVPSRGTLLAATAVKLSRPKGLGMSRAGDAMEPVKAIAALLDLFVAIFDIRVAWFVSLEIRDIGLARHITMEGWGGEGGPSGQVVYG